MSRIFVSYSRENESVVKDLVGDLEAMGHEVWFDQELSGGQNWWDKILAQIRECDLFVFALAPASVDSTACKREYQYAANLRRPILPALVADGVSTNALPSALSQVQFVDYRQPDRSTALRLARAVAGNPAAPPLPDPLPEAPKVPLSYLGGLREQIDAEAAMTFESQSMLLIELKRSLRDSGTRDDGLKLLRLFRQRRDLLATIAEEIDWLLNRGGEPATAAAPAGAAAAATAAAPAREPVKQPTPEAVNVPQPEPVIVQRQGPSKEERFKAAGISGAAGAVAGMVAGGVGLGVISGVIMAIAGLITARRRRVIIAALLCGGITAITFGVSVGPIERFEAALATGSLGSLVGAIAGAGIEWLKTRRKAMAHAGAPTGPA